MLSRRKFAQVLAVGMLTLSTLTLTGCNALKDFINWIPVGLSSLAALVKLLDGTISAGTQAIIVLIQAGFSALLTALQNLQSGKGLLADVTADVSEIESNFASFFASLNVPSTLLNLIEGLGDILLSTISGFLNSLGSSTTASATFKLGAKTVSYVPKKRSIKQYRSDWNAAAVAGGHPEAQI